MLFLTSKKFSPSTWTFYFMNCKYLKKKEMRIKKQKSFSSRLCELETQNKNVPTQ